MRKMEGLTRHKYDITVICGTGKSAIENDSEVCWDEQSRPQAEHGQMRESSSGGSERHH
jgi:hypothetical protein